MDRSALQPSKLQVVSQGLTFSSPKKTVTPRSASAQWSVRKTSQDRCTTTDLSEDCHFVLHGTFHSYTFDNSSLLQLLPPKRRRRQKQSPVNFVQSNIQMIQQMPHKRVCAQPLTKPSTSKRSLNVQERFSNYQAAKEEKLRQVRQAQEEAETLLCPFTPKTRNSNPQRSPTQLYQNLMSFETDRLQKLEEQRKLSQSPPPYSFRPTICPKSQRLVEFRPYMSMKCEKRLHQMYKPSDYKHRGIVSTCSEDETKYSEDSISQPGTMKLTRMSRELVRTQPIEERLYQEALRRRAPKSIPESNRSFSMSAKSLSLLASRFLAEFKAKSVGYDLAVNYTHFAQLLRALGFVQASQSQEQTVAMIKLWEQLAGDASRIALDDLKVGLMAVMGYYQPWMSDSDKQQLEMTEANVRKFHKKYCVLFKNRTSYTQRASPKTSPRSPPAGGPKRTKPDKLEEDQQSVVDKLKEFSDSFDALSPVPVATPSLDVPIFFQPVNDHRVAKTDDVLRPKHPFMFARTHTMNPSEFLHRVEGNSPILLEPAYIDSPRFRPLDSSFKTEKSQGSNAIKDAEEAFTPLTSGPARLSTIRHAEVSIEVYSVEEEVSRKEGEHLQPHVDK